VKSDSPDLTVLLHRINGGDKEAENRLYELVLPELRRFAGYLMGRERAGHTIGATELVNRAYLRLAGPKLSLRDRGHFFAIVARAMRRELIDYARGRGDAQIVRVEAIPEAVLATANPLDVAMLVDELLDSMRQTMAVECSIVELKCFLGFTDEEAAHALDLPLRTMQLKWHDARAWLFERAEARQWKPQNPVEPTS
jgi:RNA polymerase sigma factor (TIGR02999 family)